MLSLLHRPVLLAETVAALAPLAGETHYDATLGSGGHGEGILEAAPGVRLIGSDRDPEALTRTRDRLGGRGEFHASSFRGIPALLEELGVARLDGLLADLGVSSDQIETAQRGFSFRGEGPLDMRMDPSQGLPLIERLVETDEETLAGVIRTYGEEPRAKPIARRILESLGEIQTTRDLADVVSRAAGGRRGRIHPATRTFQALRIWVNDELGELEALLASAPGLLAGGGRLVVLSYHSLEDRIVKEKMKAWRATSIAREISRHPVRPKWIEVEENPRARSAKLRRALFA